MELNDLKLIRLILADPNLTRIAYTVAISVVPKRQSAKFVST